MTDETSPFLSILADIEQDEKRSLRSRRAQERNKSSNRITRHIFWIGLLSSFLIAAGFVIWVKFGGPAWARLAAVSALGLGYLTILLQPILLAWFHRQTLREVASGPFAAVLRANVTQPMDVDSRHLPRLIELPRIELELGLLALKMEAQFFEKRISWVVGSIDKIGIVPGCLAILVSLQKLGEQSTWVTAVAAANIGLFLLGTLANVYVVRYQRMIGLTELAIKQQELRDKERAADKDLWRTCPSVECATSRALV
jgi:hypothetical protein